MNGFKVSQMLSTNIQGPGSAASNRMNSVNSNTQNSKFAQVLDGKSSSLTAVQPTTTNAGTSSSASSSTSIGSTGSAADQQPDDITMQRMELVQQNMTQQPAQVEIDQDDDPPPSDS